MFDSRGTSGDEEDTHGLFGPVMKTIGQDDFLKYIHHFIDRRREHTVDIFSKSKTENLKKINMSYQ